MFNLSQLEIFGIPKKVIQHFKDIRRLATIHKGVATGHGRTSGARP